MAIGSAPIAELGSTPGCIPGGFRQALWCQVLSKLCQNTSRLRLYLRMLVADYYKKRFRSLRFSMSTIFLARIVLMPLQDNILFNEERTSV